MVGPAASPHAPVRDKRWLKSVADADLVEFFGDEEFNASDYANGFFEKNPAARAPARCEKLESLKRQTEEALREEVVRNYQTFMHATEQIQSMESDIETLKSLLAKTKGTLSTFQTIRLLEPMRPGDRPTGGGPGGHSPRSPQPQSSGSRADSTAKGLKLPEWLDKAPTELEELLLERKHSEAVSLVGRVREFSANVRNAMNLGQGVSSIFSRVEEMASSLARRLIGEISETNVFTAWGYREHKKNFALLIALGHAEAAATAFVKERSTLIRRSLRMVEVTADPLSYVKAVSEVFFGQVVDSVSGFLKLFCGSSKQHERRSSKTGKSSQYYQVYTGVKKCGTGPFCRLVVWVDQQIDQYAMLVGRQIRTVNVGASVTRREEELPRMLSSYGGEELLSKRQSSRALLGGSSSQGARLGLAASSLFSVVSLMLEEAFAEAAALNGLGFPVGVNLASRLVPDVAAFLENYMRQVESNLDDLIEQEVYKKQTYQLLPPEGLQSVTDPEEQALSVSMTASASVMVREARDMLEYSLVLLEPPPPVEDEDEPPPPPASKPRSRDVSPEPAPPPSPTPISANDKCGYYTRDEFLELQPLMVRALEGLVRRYTESVRDHLHRQRSELTDAQVAGARDTFRELGGVFVPALAAWCAELLPEIADEEEMTALRALEKFLLEEADLVKVDYVLREDTLEEEETDEPPNFQ